VRTVGELVSRLGPGQVGCLASGATFREDVTIEARGRPRRPVILRSVPGRPRARIVGRLVVSARARDVEIRDLWLDGRNARRLPSPTVNGTRIRFVGNDVSNRHTGICFVLGSDQGYGIARAVVLRRNLIHRCGRLPATNHDHGIYVERARGTLITDNVILDNADRGIQLYPDAQRTRIRHNLVVGNGVGILFGGDDGHASSGTVVRANIIAFSRRRHDVEAHWPPGNPVGSANLVVGNCVHGGARGPFGAPEGFTQRRNRVADPRLAATVSGVPAPPATGPCAGFGPRLPPVGVDWRRR
jgi:parallel beta-helix repeat protein